MNNISDSKADLSVKSNLDSLIDFLKSHDVSFDKGLTDSEIDMAEEKCKFIFPPDLRTFLQYALPVDSPSARRRSYPNWRDLNDDYIAQMMRWPLEGIFFDLEHNDFWMDDFGEKPPTLEEKKMIAAKLVDSAPRLIPIRGHRFIPAEPYEVNNPIFSVWQTDIIYYGLNLYDYFQREFLGFKNVKWTDEPKKIRMWSKIIESE